MIVSCRWVILSFLLAVGCTNTRQLAQAPSPTLAPRQSQVLPKVVSAAEHPDRGTDVLAEARAPRSAVGTVNSSANKPPAISATVESGSAAEELNSRSVITASRNSQEQSSENSLPNSERKYAWADSSETTRSPLHHTVAAAGQQDPLDASHSETTVAGSVVSRTSGEPVDSWKTNGQQAAWSRESEIALASDETPRPSALTPPAPAPPMRADDESQLEIPLILPPLPDAAEAFLGKLSLENVLNSVQESYPLLDSALFNRNIAIGEQVAAAGNLDTKLAARSENGPVGFYENFRQNIGVVQPLYQGGEVFAGYRIGRGSFEPWYKERQTNGGGEFRVGAAIPLLRDREIDPRRAEIWKTEYNRQLVEPDIQAQLIDFSQQARYAYWNWVAAGAKLEIANQVLHLAVDRVQRLERQVELDFLDPPVLYDNQRLIAERRGRLADSRRKLEQSAVKLSIYYRGPDGNPIVPPVDLIPRFPLPTPLDAENLAVDIQSALRQRPEVSVLNFIQRQFEVDYAQARNEYLPAVDAVISGAKDMGAPTSPKNDKGPFELDASVFVEVPVQRRKAIGKMQAIEGKIAQLRAKRRITEDKIVADVQTAYAGLLAAQEQVGFTQEALVFAEDLARRERLNFEQGESDLLTVALREQFAAEAADKVVDALFLFYLAEADYQAAMAYDRVLR